MAKTLTDVINSFSDAYNHLSEQEASQFCGLWDSSKAAFLAGFAQIKQSSGLILCADQNGAEKWYADLSFFGHNKIDIFPAWETLLTEKISPHIDIIGERMSVLHRIISDPSPIWVIAPVQSLFQKIISPQRLQGELIALKLGDSISLENLVRRLIELGYKREPVVENRADFCVRGGMIDIFIVHLEMPIRIELDADRIVSIRYFNVQTQLSEYQIQSFCVLPAIEMELDHRENTILDYFNDHVNIIVDDYQAIEKTLRDLNLGLFHETSDLCNIRETYISLCRIFISEFEQEIPHAKTHRFDINRLGEWTIPLGSDIHEHIQQSVPILTQYSGYDIFIICSNDAQLQRVQEILQKSGKSLDDFHFLTGQLSSGFMLCSIKTIILTDNELFGRIKLRVPRKRISNTEPLGAYQDLHEEDCVVHLQHGIGRFKGLRTLFMDGVQCERMLIEYKDGAKLYVPLDQIDLVERYISVKGKKPAFNRIGSRTWDKTKIKAQRALQDFASELLDMYSRRLAHKGHAFSKDIQWQHEFEDGFVYDETPDQVQAIIDVKKDMESEMAMDRLICGDVGFGKTEVAIRAAFKAVMDGKQVAVVVPTTILAQQHQYTFAERFANYPICVDVLSRFRTAREQQDIISAIKNGTVDVVIGTHRLLGSDVCFKDLGLVIIDEEQRFGVAHKEKLKKMRLLVDVLTLSATPIPRTLYLAMTKARDMSQINTPPQDRLPVETIVAPYRDQLVKEAIQREIARFGQVFYVYNRVRSIDAIKKRLENLVPNLSIGIAHGQMLVHELEDIMKAFIEGRIQVLVCTNIVESGLDIPNANTIIIDGAELFGLADLYQLRGRVGRFRRRAYAYICYRGTEQLLEKAKMRLKTIEDFTQLGSGFKIALSDLEIRGAGNILGKEQHGHISCIGFNLYCRLLEHAIKRLNGETVLAMGVVSLQLGIDTRIPKEYINDDHLRMDMHRRIADIHDAPEYSDLMKQLQDRFGCVPKSVINLLDCTIIKNLARSHGIDSIQRSGTKVIFKRRDRIIKIVTSKNSAKSSKITADVINILKKF
ncbi:MAG: transcription-repair coupling factor [Chlamydiota bacterium]|nr:transcription-repair coupling factor [Chlamydiota bacterium]